MTSYIKKLPAVFQTTTESKFFNSTFDQVFSKKDSDLLAGYLGRRVPGYYNPVTDFYLPEPSKNRTWWQLEATAFARTEDTTKSNIFFYDDLLEKIQYYGGNTLNQDRLFESEYYSFGPPIDYDMFTNYHNYYWVEQGLATINISGISGAQINALVIGKPSFNTNQVPGATPTNLTLTTGMNVSFVGATDYSTPHIVENVGGCGLESGIRLTPQFPDFSSGTIFEYLPWDGFTQLSTGRIIDNIHWDATTWDTQTQPSVGDYITIERGSIDRNAWSRTNKWFHLDAINTTMSVLSIPFPVNATRALRPIIQFIADLTLYKSGTEYIADLNYGFLNLSGSPILRSTYEDMPVSWVNSQLTSDFTGGELVSFFYDTSDYGGGILVNQYVFEVVVTMGRIHFTPNFSITTPLGIVPDGGIVIGTEDTSVSNITRGSTWYYTSGASPAWLQATNEKIKANQTPLFQLYDHNGIPLDDISTYPDSDFTGNPIFSYKVDTTPGATHDPVLKFPIVYTALGQISDIMFQNNLMTSRYTYILDSKLYPINGYYYYKTLISTTLYNNWNLYNPCPCDTIDPPPPANCLTTSKQRVINRYVVGYGSEYTFKLSVIPYGYPASADLSPDIIVVVNNVEIKSVADQPTDGYTLIEINNEVYVDLTTYLTILLATYQKQPPVVEIQTYTHGLLKDSAPGYFQIPQQLEANPNQLEVFDISGSDLSHQFASIIANQIGETGVVFGGSNNYRDTRKNRSVGTFILQNVSPLLKTMLISSSDDLSFITGERFSQDEYTKFKNKYLSTALQLINQGFNPLQYKNNTIVISAWVDTIIKTISISNEFSNAFAYSYMIANGAPYMSEIVLSPGNSSVILANYLDLSDPKNALYVYDVVDPTLPSLLLIGRDYEIISNNNTIEVQLNMPAGTPTSITSISGNGSSISPTVTVNYVGPAIPVGYYVQISGVTGTSAYNGTYEVITSVTNQFTYTSSISGTGAGGTFGGGTFGFYLYKNPLPAYIPSTPSKIGAYPTYVPRIELDTTYVTPTNVIIGHDGSKTIAYNDYRDQLLLELETRIYNLIQYKFRHQYYLPIRLESVKSGYFRQTRYSRQEYLDITESYLNKWAAKYKANYRINDWYSASLDPDVNTGNIWKLYNYRDAVDTFAQPLNLPGNWKGIFQYYYDTYYPDTRPWEMLGFSEEPSWWQFEYGAPVLNLAGQEVWTSTANGAHDMWIDLEAGYIRQGPSAIYNAVTLLVEPQPMWARPGLSFIIPVDVAGELISVMDLFDVAFSGNYYAPFDHFDADWIYGDGAPVEQAWMSTSAYAFSIQEFLYLMKPAPYGELMWDTIGTELSPGMIIVPESVDPVMSDTNWQFVQNDTFTNSDPFFAWMRPKNKDQIVHAESIDNIIQVRYGYQRWISDRILFLGKDITSTFGQKVRTLDVNLANKLAGFTNKDSTNLYIEAVSPNASTNTLIIPSTNFDVLLHKSPVVDTYSYSGIIIRALADGTFAVYGYDLLSAAFTVLNRSDATLIEVTIGGTPAGYQYFTAGATYNPGDIVRYNGIYYVCLAQPGVMWTAFNISTTYAKSVVVKYNDGFYSSNANGNIGHIPSATSEYWTIMPSVNQPVQKFISSNYQKLKSLPIVGGVSVSYKPVSDVTTTVIPYGTILKDDQAVFDLMIGWGAYLETQGWKFDEVNQDTNILSDWLYSAKQFLFWLNTNWAPDASIQLSPLANKATLVVSRGYPNDVESLSNGVYSILDKYGVAIPPNNTATNRDGKLITVEPTTVASGGIYYLQVNTSETEHVLIFDNTTNFNDTVYSPLLRARQERLRFYGFRSNGWYGKMEAPGYLILDNQLIPNFDTIVDSMRYFYDPNVVIDNPSLEDLGRHLIGYESKSYLDNLQVADNVQYLFYQGAIRQKGTAQAFEKLFRSTKIQTNEIIKVYEEWALKLGKFGNTIDQVSTEFILTPEINNGEVIVARLNFIPSSIGFVKQINILNAQNTYNAVPKVIIGAPDAQPDVVWTVWNNSTAYTTDDVVRYDDAQGNAVYYSSNVIVNLNNTPSSTSIYWTTILATRIAKAYIVLGIDSRISRVDITDPGYGYLQSPIIDINSGAESHIHDRLYSIWQGEIIKDVSLDNVIDIDIDQTSVWTVRPNDPSYSLVFPVTTNINYSSPNAGYVNFNDVTWTSFDVTQTAVNWGSPNLNPAALDTVWIAKNFTEDWSVYKLVNFGQNWSITKDPDDNLILLTDLGVSIIPQLWNSITGERTDFGNMIVVQQVIDGRVIGDNNYTVGILPYTTEDYVSPGTYTDPTTLITYNAYYLTTLAGVPITIAEIGNYADFTNLLLYKTMRWYNTPVEPLLPVYVGLGDLIWVDDVSEKWVVFKIQADPGIWDITGWDLEVIDFWSPNYGWDVTGPMYFTLYRTQEALINTSLFENVGLFSSSTKNEMLQLPIYDPFKDILPGPAKQNITYVSTQDPASYNVTADETLFSENITFAGKQVGQLWWDTSSAKYVYYEQPIALDGSETTVDNIIYRRNRWGQLFPGSTITMYEWVKSSVPPALYIGTGVPKDTTTYVQVRTSNTFTNATETNYYFWVLNTTDKPNVENRTMAAIDVARLLQSPKSQGFSFFSPIQQTSINNCYMFYNTQGVFAYNSNNVQIKYRLTERDDQEHVQWAFFREGDSGSIVTDQFWNKMVDSLCGYTKTLPISDEYTGLTVADNPWDVYGWDTLAWDSYGEILPVPDPTLSEGEKYGIDYRPRQGMFVSLSAARKIFVQAGNQLLKYIPIRESNPYWDVNVPTHNYWVYTNWYALGYEDVIPNFVYQTQSEADAVLALGNIFHAGDIVEVTNGTSDGRFILYAIVQLNPNLPMLSFDPIGIENSAILLLDTIYTETNLYGLSTDIRGLLNAFRTEVMIDAYFVDQNELFFSMMNYVLSEQKDPNWLFKTSYIYIKESNMPLAQDQFYMPDQIDNIIQFITDSKPYHTQIRDYTSSNTTFDVAEGTAIDSYSWNIKVQFGPDYAGETYVVPYYILNAKTFTDNIPQFVSRDDVYTVDLTSSSDITKKGYSQLYPYTFTFDDVNLNNPQNITTPYNIVGIQADEIVLIYGQDYYVEDNGDTTYTVYFYNDPSGYTTLIALVWFDGGQFTTANIDTYRNETANGIDSSDDLVINVDTKLPVNDISGIISLAPLTRSPYVGWGESWDEIGDPVISSILTSLPGGIGTASIPWDAPLVSILLPNTISFKENTNINDGANFYRNAEVYSGTLINDVLAPTADTEYLDVITVTAASDIFPDPGVTHGTIWINGERIQYRMKTQIEVNTWELRLIQRGTMGTSATAHLVLIPSLDAPLILVSNPVWVERNNIMPMNSNIEVWNAIDSTPTSTSFVSDYGALSWGILPWAAPLDYTDVTSVPIGGLWYAYTPESTFLKQAQGISIP